MDKYDVLGYAAPGGVFLLNSPYGPDEIWDQLAREVQQEIIDKQLRFYVIDAFAVARDTGMGTRINTVMQTCFFAISGVLPRDEAIAQIKKSIEKTYGKRGPEVVRKNFAAVDQTLEQSPPGRRCPPPSRPPARCRRSSPTRRRTSSSASPRSCWPTRATCCR